jgi:magnesium chelatase subunit I
MIFPFAALVNQDEMKTALILNVIDPSIGGLLIMGEKGTGKSTAVRALAELLPEMDAVKDCPFACDADGMLCSDCREMLARDGHLIGNREERVVGIRSASRGRMVGKNSFRACDPAAARSDSRTGISRMRTGFSCM